MDIHTAMEGVYAAESGLGDPMHTLLLKGLLESTHSLLKHTTECMEKLSRQRTIWQKLFDSRNPLLGMIEKIKNFQLFGGGLQWMQGQLFKSRYLVNEDYDGGDDVEFFQTGTVVFRCEVHLDILVAVCQDLHQLGQNKYSNIVKQLKKPMRSIFPKTANKVSALKRLSHLVSYGDSSMPLDALNTLLRTSRPGQAGIISRATQAAAQFAEKQENQLKLLQMMWSHDNDDKLSAQIQHVKQLVKDIREVCGLAEETKDDGGNKRTLAEWLASSRTPLGEDVRDKLFAAGWTDDNFSSKAEEDIPDTVIGGFRSRLRKLIKND